MKKKSALTLAPLICFAVVALLFAAALVKGTRPQPSVPTGRAAPAFDLPSALAGGRGFSARDLKGAPAIVNFFASWCLTCAVEQKTLADMAEKSGVPLYGVAYKDKKEDARKWLARHGNPFRAVGLDADGSAAIDWGVFGVPETFVVDGEGRVRYRHAGPVTEEDAARVFLPLLEGLRK